MKRIVLCLALCLAGCNAELPPPVVVPTGSNTEAVGSYETFTCKVMPKATGKGVQDAVVTWLKAHPDLKFIQAIPVNDYNVSEGANDGTIELVIVGYRDASGKETR